MSVVDVLPAQAHLFDPGDRKPPKPVTGRIEVTVKRGERVDLAAMLDTPDFQNWVNDPEVIEDLTRRGLPEWRWPGLYIEDMLTDDLADGLPPDEVRVDFRWTPKVAAEVERALRVRW